MARQEVKDALEAIKKLTYLEWNKVKHCVDVRFQDEIDSRTRSQVLENSGDLLDSYEQIRW